MSPSLLIILISVGAVALFALGLSISLIVRGRHIDSEISENENMRRLGIKCAAKEGEGGCAEGGGCGLHPGGEHQGCESCEASRDNKEERKA